MNNKARSNEDREAIIYCRTANAVQDKETGGIDAQIARCREYAQDEGFSVTNIFAEDGISGEAADRPEIRRMIDCLNASAGTVTVIIDDMSRLARDLDANLQVREAISDAGALLEVVSSRTTDDATRRYIDRFELIRRRMEAQMMDEDPSGQQPKREQGQYD